MEPSDPCSDSYCNNCFETTIFYQKSWDNSVGNWKGINPMGLSSTLDKYKNKQFFTNMKISQTTLIRNKKNHRGLNQ